MLIRPRSRTGDPTRLLRTFIGTVLGFLIVALGASAQPVRKSPPSGFGSHSALSQIELSDSDSAERCLGEYSRRKYLVLAFLGTGCPLSGRSIQTLSELQTRFAAQGVQFVGICASLEDTPASVDRYAREYRCKFPVLRDPRQQLANQLKARVTPEVFLLDGARTVRYRGWIDGHEPGTSGPLPIRKDGLLAALTHVLAGRDVRTPVTQAGGCEIGRPTKPANAGATTYHRDVAPILQRHCESCHRPGQSAPFALTTYLTAQSRAAQIKRLTASREMPPWLAEPGYGDFEHSRRMSADEIRTLAAWAEAGAPEGEPATAPSARSWPEGWVLGQPDLILKPAVPYQIAATGDDEFRVFVLPTNIPADREIVAIDVRPGNARVVHHVLGLFDSSGKGRELDAADPKPGYSSGPGGVLVPTATLQMLWTPGSSPSRLPAGVARRLTKGTDLLLQIHYHKTGRDETDQPSVGLYFAREPITREARTAVVGGWHLPIPAGNAAFRVRSAERSPYNVRLLSVTPHMHLLGKSMKVSITLPNGVKQDLIWIKKWDYRWQETYRLRQPILLPPDTEIEIVAWFDNSAANPRNPHRPPKNVEFGELTTNEMASVILEGVVE